MASPSLDGTDRPLLELDNVTRVFDRDARTGVRDVTFGVERGEYVAILGPSGAGKSTLLNLLGILDRPDSGRYRFDGVSVGELGEAERNALRSRRIGFVFQSAFVLGDESALSNAALGLRTQGVRLPRRSALARRALERLGIGARWDVPARVLSGGERQRLALARAIAPRPDLVLADEPTGNLDSASGGLVLDALEALNRDGTTVVVITHDPAVAARARRRITIVDGEAHEESTDPVRGGSVRPGASPLRGAGSDSPSHVAPTARLRERVLDDLADAVAAISHRPLRSLVLALAFTLGIGGLVASLGLGESASAQVSDRLTRAALDEVRIVPPDGSGLLDPGDPLLDDWIERLRSIPHVVDAGFVATVPSSIASIRRLGPDGPPSAEDFVLVTASSGYLRLMGVADGDAARLALLDRAEVASAAWLGADAARGIGVAPAGPGSALWAAGRKIDVAGTFSAGSRASGLDRMVVVSRDVLAGLPQAQPILVIRTEPGFPAAVAEVAPLALDPANPGRFTVETVADLRELRFGVANDLGVFLGVLAAVLLGLAVVSASTAMYLSVQSRAPEIALRRAVGASRADVARLFLAEGLLIGTAGGALGALAGSATALLAALAQGWDAVLPPALVPLSAALGVVTGFASASLPAWSASRQEPAMAIRT